MSLVKQSVLVVCISVLTVFMQAHVHTCWPPLYKKNQAFMLHIFVCSSTISTWPQLAAWWCWTTVHACLH